MLNQYLRILLMQAAETKDIDKIDQAIERVKALSPESFFSGDKDEALAKRVFVTAPRSAKWSGSALTYESLYERKRND